MRFLRVFDALFFVLSEEYALYASERDRLFRIAFREYLDRSAQDRAIVLRVLDLLRRLERLVERPTQDSPKQEKEGEPRFTF